MGAQRLPAAFYRRPGPVVARDLLGRILCRRLPDGSVLRGRVVEVQVPLPEYPARLYQAPDLSKLEAVGAGAYAGESVPLYGPRPHPASSGSVR